jgi:SOS response regulatory protein OraA/RecX
LQRARKMGHLDPATSERRLTAALARRGFSHSAIRSAVRGALKGGTGTEELE